MAVNFPAKIYLILENESSDIIKWHPNGLAFRIVDHGRFEREIIPKYFRHNQLSSVQRQLNLYGFKCINRGEDKGAFYHPRFKRGEWEVVKKITRYSPAKKPDSPQFGGEKASELESFDAPFTSAYPANISTDGSFHQPSMSTGAYGSQAYGFPPFHFESSSNSAPWFSSNMYGHLGYNMPMDFHQGAHFSSSFNSSVPVAAPIAMYPQKINGGESNMLSPAAAATAADTGAMSTSNSEVDNINYQEDNCFAEVSTKAKSFVNVVNDVVLVDPYFDLDAELDMFCEVGLSNSSMMSTSPSMGTTKMVSNTREIGINTDVSLAHHNLSTLDRLTC